MRLQIGDWMVDPDLNLIERGADRRRLEHRSMQVLTRLAARPGQLITKGELIDEVWNGRAVSDHSLAVVISDLRKAFGDDRREPAYFETVARRGYCLVAPVQPALTGPTVQPECPPSAPDIGSPTTRRSGPVIALLALGLLVLGAIIWALWPAPGARPLVVTTFANASGDPAFDHVAFAAGEVAATVLANGIGRPVIRWRGEGRDDLPTDADILDGHVVRDGARMQLAVAYTASDGTVRWAHIYDLRDGALGVVTDDIARRSAEAAGIALAAAPAPPAPAVYELYWRGRWLWSRRDHESLLAARQAFESALALDPAYAPAHAALADLYAHKTGESLGLPRAETFALAERHLAEARRIAPETPELLVTAAYLAFNRDRDRDGALALLDRAVAAQPRNALARQTRAMVLTSLRRHDEGAADIAAALALDPLSDAILWDRVWFDYIAGRTDEGLAHAEEAMRLSAPVYSYRALLHQARGDAPAALADWMTRAGNRGLALGAASDEIQALARQDPAAAYRRLLAAMDAHPGYVEVPALRAALELFAGNRDRAIAAIETIGESWWLGWIDQMPAIAPLLTEPRVNARRLW